jgi:hypothetical protein
MKPYDEAVVLRALNKSAVNHKANLSPFVRQRIVQWAKAAQQRSPGRRLPLADSYIQEWWIDGENIVVMFSEQHLYNLDKISFSASLLDNDEFTVFVKDSFRMGYQRAQQDFDNARERLANEERALTKEIV